MTAETLIHYRIIGGSHDGEWVSFADERPRPMIQMYRPVVHDWLTALDMPSPTTYSIPIERYELAFDALLLPVMVCKGLE